MSSRTNAMISSSFVVIIIISIFSNYDSKSFVCSFSAVRDHKSTRRLMEKDARRTNNNNSSIITNVFDEGNRDDDVFHDIGEETTSISRVNNSSSIFVLESPLISAPGSSTHGVTITSRRHPATTTVQGLYSTRITLDEKYWHLHSLNLEEQFCDTISPYLKYYATQVDCVVLTPISWKPKGGINEDSNSMETILFIISTYPELDSECFVVQILNRRSVKKMMADKFRQNGVRVVEIKSTEQYIHPDECRTTDDSPAAAAADGGPKSLPTSVVVSTSPSPKINPNLQPGQNNIRTPVNDEDASSSSSSSSSSSELENGFTVKISTVNWEYWKGYSYYHYVMLDDMIVPKWGSVGFKDSLRICANSCLNTENCVAFDYPNNTHTPHCSLHFGEESRKITTTTTTAAAADATSGSSSSYFHETSESLFFILSMSSSQATTTSTRIPNVFPTISNSERGVDSSSSLLPTPSPFLRPSSSSSSSSSSRGKNKKLISGPSVDSSPSPNPSLAIISLDSSTTAQGLYSTRITLDTKYWHLHSLNLEEQFCDTISPYLKYYATKVNCFILTPISWEYESNSKDSIPMETLLYIISTYPKVDIECFVVQILNRPSVKEMMAEEFRQNGVRVVEINSTEQYINPDKCMKELHATENDDDSPNKVPIISDSAAQQSSPSTSPSSSRPSIQPLLPSSLTTNQTFPPPPTYDNNNNNNTTTPTTSSLTINPETINSLTNGAIIPIANTSWEYWQGNCYFVETDCCNNIYFDKVPRWGHPDALYHLQSCAKRCQERNDCVAFNYPNNSILQECFIIRNPGRQQSPYVLGVECSRFGETMDWMYFTRLEEEDLLSLTTTEKEEEEGKYEQRKSIMPTVVETRGRYSSSGGGDDDSLSPSSYYHPSSSPSTEEEGLLIASITDNTSSGFVIMPYCTSMVVIVLTITLVFGGVII